MSTVQSPGCVIFLMDESAAMGAVMGDVVTDGKASTKSNAERVATALNSLLAQLSSGPSFDVAVVGYQADGAGQVNVGCRWQGPLAGREFVPTGELAASPLRVETRTRKIPAAGGFGTAREEPVSFPVWYAPALGVKAPQIAAFNYCRELLTNWLADAGPGPGLPLVLHVSSGGSGDGNPQMAIDKLMRLATPSGQPLLFQAHLAARAALVTSVYPSNQMYLTLGSARDLFRRASQLPPDLAAALKEAKVPVNVAARGLLYNAKIADLIRMLGLVKAHVKDWPSKGAPVPAPAAEEAAPLAAAPADAAATVAEAGLATATIPAAPADVPAGAEKAALVVLLLDRSIDDPFSGCMDHPCAKLQEHANDLLKQVSKLKDGVVESAIISYGQDGSGQVEVRDTFEGPLAGQSTVRQAELADGAVRVDEYTEEVSNGIGGLISMTRKKPIYFDLEPTTAAASAPGFAAAARIASQWCSAHPAAALAPIVLHLTRGRLDPAEVEQAAAQLQSIQAGGRPVTLYHLVVTESPHKSLAYAESDSDLEDAALKKLWELSSPLLGRERLAAEKPSVTPGSRGIVINGKFDLFLEEIKQALA